MLAVRFESDIAQQHDLVVASDFFECALKVLAGILGITGKPLFIRVNDPRRRPEQPFAVGIVAGPADEGAHGVLSLGAQRPYD